MSEPRDYAITSLFPADTPTVAAHPSRAGHLLVGIGDPTHRTEVVVSVAQARQWASRLLLAAGDVECAE